MNYSTHRIRYYAPISHKGRARQIGMKADGTWQQKCSKDWIDLDEVEMENLQFVGCSWFIGLIGLVFRFTQNKFTETEHVRDPAPPLSLLDYT